MIQGKTKAKVLYLSYDGLTDFLGQSQILPYLCGLSTEGFAISVISFEKQDHFANNQIDVQKICDAYQLKWYSLPYHKFPPVLSTLYDLVLLRNKVKYLLKKSQFNIIHCRSYPSSLIGLWAKRRFGVKFIFDMRGFWADERIESALWNLRNPLYNLIYNYFKKKETAFLQESQAIISLTHAAKEYLMNNFSINPASITVIPCSVDLDLFNPEKITEEEKNKLRKDLGISEDDFVLLYLGSLGTWYMYKNMVDFFEELKKLKPHAKFLFLTPDKEEVQSRSDFIVRTVRRSEVPLHCSIAHVAIFFIKPSFSKMASSATKMGEVMAMGLEVITNKGWGDIEVMAAQGLKVWIYDGRPLEQKWLQQIQLKKNSNKNYVVSEMSLKTAVWRYSLVYNTVLAHS